MKNTAVPRKKARQARSKATVEAIVGATARVFVSEGFDGASTNRIATVAGVSIGSLYQYFPNKEALAAELIERHLGELLELLTETLAQAAGRPLQEGIPLLVRALFEAHRQDPKLHRVLLEAGSRVGMDTRKREVMGQFHQYVRRYFESHRTEIAAVDLDLDLGAYLLVFAAENVMREVQLAPPSYPLEQVIEGVATMCLRYLGIALSTSPSTDEG